jgi:hypothetical protein
MIQPFDGAVNRCGSCLQQCYAPRA